MTYENILLEAKESVALITFNRPKALNALSTELMNEFSCALYEIAENEDIRVLVLTGAGGKAFVAGADISELSRFTPLQAKFFTEKGQETIDRIQQLPIPVIAAVNGFALGGGCEIALACDFIYASDNAKLGLPEINLGLIPGFGGTQRLPRLIGTNMAKEMIYTGMMIGAEEARQIGLVNRVFPAVTLMDEAMKTAKAIASKGNVSIRAAKQAINHGMNADLATGCKYEIDAFALCFSSEDAREGTAAFIEKRKAVFSGRLKG